MLEEVKKEVKKKVKKEVKFKGSILREGEVDSSKQFTCSLCTSSFAKRKGLYHHKLRVHPNCKPQDCKLCGKNFKSKKHLNAHTTTVHKTLSYSCIKCKKSIKYLKRLNYHEQFCGTWKRSKGHIPCGLCDKTFATENNLKYHIIRTHTVVSKLGTFIMTCIGESKKKTTKEDIICSLCKTHFLKTNYLKKHMKLVHETKREVRQLIQVVVERVLSSDSTYQYNCNQCLKCFSKESLAKGHIRRVHVEKEFQCDICTRKFKLNQSLQEHIKRHNQPKSMKKLSKHLSSLEFII